MNEHLANAFDAEQNEGSEEQSEITIVQLDHISEADLQEVRIGEPSIKVGNKRLKVHEPGEDWL